MNSHEYRAYVLSEAWRRNPARVACLRQAQGRCRACQQQTRVYPHHITYERCPHRELLADLVALCDPCHKQVHQLARLLTGRRTGALRFATYAIIARKRLAA